MKNELTNKEKSIIQYGVLLTMNFSKRLTNLPDLFEMGQGCLEVYYDSI